MPLETNLTLDITTGASVNEEEVKAYLENEFRRTGNHEIRDNPNGGIHAWAFGFLAELESSGIGYFSEVENLLNGLEKIAPGFKCHGDWEVDYTVAADAPPDHWEFDWVEAKVVNVVDLLEKDLEEAGNEWAIVFAQSEVLKPEMFAFYMYECPMPPFAALSEIECEDPDEPFDDEETISYGEVAAELNRVIGDGENCFGECWDDEDWDDED